MDKQAPKQHAKTTLTFIFLICALAAGWYARGWFAPATEHAAPPETAAPHAQEEGTVWTCSMHPQIRQPNPGLCPICAMELIPLVESGDGGATNPRQLTVSEAARALMDIETTAVERRFVEAEVRMVGKVALDETTLAYISAWVPGRIERLYADYTGTVVQRGDHMVDLYSPELLSAREELRRAYETLDKLPANAPDVLRNTAESTLEAVRSKLRRWGMTEGQIQQAEKGGVSDRVTIYAPISGTVIERMGQEGMYVETGERIYAIADLSKVWVMLQAYESDLAWLHFGQTVEFGTEAYPGQQFEGKIAFISPTLDDRTRTVQVRVNVDNSDGRLKPGMFVRAVVRSLVATGGRVMDPGLAGKWISPMHPEIVKDAPGKCDICGMDLVPAEQLGYVPATASESDMPLVIPVSAPLITGKRAVVYVEILGKEKPTYEVREVQLGSRAGNFYAVKSGLEEGERVVVRGNFKLDSELEIQARPSMMSIPSEEEHAKPPVDPILRQALRHVFAPYLALQDALAHDRLEEANAALAALQQAVASEEHAAKLGALGKILNGHANFSEIEALRELFSAYSMRYIKEIEDYGIAEGAPVYRFNCPMAADWLQADADLRNPYMGARMFTCGTLLEWEADMAEAAASAPAPAAQSGGHVHE